MAVRIAQAARKGMNMPRYQAQSPGPLAPHRDKDGLLDIAKPYVADVAMKKAEEKAMPMIEEGFTKGLSTLKGMFMPAPTMSGTATPLMKAGVDAGLANAAAGQAVAGAGSSAGLMAGLGTAMPYVGMGLLAGKALGFFNKGGLVGGPLCKTKVSYKAKGGEVAEIEQNYGGPLANKGE
jgi:hypothetical protein